MPSAKKTAAKKTSTTAKKTVAKKTKTGGKTAPTTNVTR